MFMVGELLSRCVFCLVVGLGVGCLVLFSFSVCLIRLCSMVMFIGLLMKLKVLVFSVFMVRFMLLKVVIIVIGVCG